MSFLFGKLSKIGNFCLKLLTCLPNFRVNSNQGPQGCRIEILGIYGSYNYVYLRMYGLHISDVQMALIPIARYAIVFIGSWPLQSFLYPICIVSY